MRSKQDEHRWEDLINNELIRTGTKPNKGRHELNGNTHVTIAVASIVWCQFHSVGTIIYTLYSYSICPVDAFRRRLLLMLSLHDILEALNWIMQCINSPRTLAHEGQGEQCIKFLKVYYCVMQNFNGHINKIIKSASIMTQTLLL